MFPLHGRRQQDLDEVRDPDGDRGAQSGAVGEEGVGDPDRLLQGERQGGRDQVPVEVYPRRRHGCGEGLPVLFGAEQRARLQQA